MDRGGPEFSCWRYRNVGPAKFLDDLAEMSRGIVDNAITPRFLRSEATND
jgi:hypothetical protein